MNNYEEEIDLIELLNNFLIKYKIGLLIIIVCGLIGLFTSLVYNYINKDKYTIVSEEKVVNKTFTTSFSNNVLDIEVIYDNPEYVISDGLVINTKLRDLVNIVNSVSYKNVLLNTSNTLKNNKFSFDNLDSILSIKQSGDVLSICISINKDTFINISNEDPDTFGYKVCIDEFNIIKDILDKENVSYRLLNTEPITYTSNSVISGDVSRNIESKVYFSPISVNKYTLIGLLIGLLIYCVYVFILTILDKSIKSISELRHLISYPILSYISDNESIKQLDITLSNISSDKNYTVISVLDNDDLVNRLNDLLDKRFIDGGSINNSSRAINLAKNNKTIINLVLRSFKREDLEITKEIIANNHIDIIGVVISNI